MKIQATCPGCQTTIAVASENAGKRARCPKCNAVIPIPDIAPAPPRRSQPGRSRPQTSPSGTSQTRNSSPSESPRGKQSESRAGQTRGGDESDRERPTRRKTSASQRRRQEPEAEDIWSQPLSSYSSPAIEEEHYEAYGITPKRAREKGEYNPYTAQREVGTYNSYKAPGYKVPVIMAAAGLGSALLFGGIGLAYPPAALAGMAIGGLMGFVLMLWGGLRIMMNAFEVDPLTGVLYLMCGPYAIYFLFSHWEVNQHPFIINLMGTIVFFVSMAVGGSVVSAN